MALPPPPESPSQAILDIEQGGTSSVFCPNSRQTLRIALNLKTLIDKVIPIVFPVSDVTGANSPVLNENVLKLVYRAAGGQGGGKPGTSSHRYQGALVFALLKVTDWYWQQREHELYDNELYLLRAVAAQTLAASLIEAASDDEYLFLSMLTHRYSINLNGEDLHPVLALELAVDMHLTTVIGSCGYQRCIKWLWRGWIVQLAADPHSYVLYKGVALHRMRTHFDPQRIKTPYYQNVLEIATSMVYLVLYTIILNGHQMDTTGLDVFEALFYVFTAGSVLDEATKVYSVGFAYVGFWTVFNSVMYAIILAAIGFRGASLNHSPGLSRDRLDEMLFRILSCAAPLMWLRLLLFLDAQRFVGAMIVVVKTMMQESLLFFVLLFVVIAGFLQGFLGLDASDGKSQATQKILVSLVLAIIGGLGIEDVLLLVPPYASVLYYVYLFLLSVILMNILVALYLTAYAAIVENATAEYFALVAQKTLRYIRAPDANLYVPPLNLVELLLLPLARVCLKSTFRSINHYLMLVLYSPFLVFIAVDELQNARRVQYNRFKGLPDDANEVDTEWDLTDGYDVGLASSSSASGWVGIEERNLEVSEALRTQREGELQDPEFRIDLRQFADDVDAVVQPVQKANKLGIKWELYELYAKMDHLTTLVEAVVAENQELRARVGGVKTEIKKEPDV